MFTRDLLDLILCPNKTTETCFLCLKSQQSTLDMFEFFEVHGANFSTTTSLNLMMKELFPTYELLLKQACEKCSNLIIQFYIFMRRNQDYQNYIALLVEDINCKLPQNIENAESNSYIIDLSKEPKSNCTLPVRDQSLNVIKPKPQKILGQHKLRNEALICDICGKTCKSPRSLNIHRKGHETKPCFICSKILKTHQHFNIHVRNHGSSHRRRNVNKTVYSCNDCKYKSYNKQTLEAHINRNHLNIRPYICELCCKGFYKKGNLNEHILLHSKVKLFTCETCGESFGRKKSLLEHARLHSGEKPFSCDICGDKFVTVSRRNTHIKRKHEEKQEVCDICGVAFSLKSYLKRHKKLVHDIIEYNSGL